MEEQFINQSQDKPITLNLDEFDLDSFELKPLNRGLGFHEEEKVKPAPVQAAKNISSRSRKSSTPKLSGNSFLQSSPQTISEAGLMTGVEAIYGAKRDVANGKKKVKENSKAKLKEADLLNVSAAFSIDLITIVATTTLLLSSFYLIGFKSFSLDGLIAFIGDSALFASVFFALSYLSYFSLLEPVGTLGKRALSLNVCHSRSRKNITIRQSFIRGLVSLMSLCLMGVPLILDFHGKLSDSRVIQE